MLTKLKINKLKEDKYPITHFLRGSLYDAVAFQTEICHDIYSIFRELVGPLFMPDILCWELECVD